MWPADVRERLTKRPRASQRSQRGPAQQPISRIRGPWRPHTLHLVSEQGRVKSSAPIGKSRERSRHLGVYGSLSANARVSRLARSHLRAVSTAPSARAFWPEPFGIPPGAPRRIGAQKPPTTAAVNRPDLQRLTDQISATIGARGASVDPPSSTDRPQLRGAGGGVDLWQVPTGRVRAATESFEFAMTYRGFPGKSQPLASKRG
jgi:hypothetical protein